MADFALAIGGEFASRGERMAEYNRLLEIEAELSGERTLSSGSPDQPHKPLPIFRRNLDAFDLAHTGRLASLPRFGNLLMRAEH